MKDKNTETAFRIPKRTLLGRIRAGRNVLLCYLILIYALPASGQTWSPKGPSARGAHSAVFDPGTDRMIVFGGRDSSGTQLNDVWRLNAAAKAGGLTWVPMKPAGTAPAGRQGHVAVYAGASNRMIIFGGGLGNTSPCENDVWALENANGSGGTPLWTQLNPSGSLPAARVYSTAVYDPSTDSMIVFGGENCFTVDFGDVWVLSHASGVSATPTWIQLLPLGSGPAARNFHAAVYARSTNTMTIFGGTAIGGTFFNDVWVLSHANGTGGTPSWTQLAPSENAPVPREAMSAIYNDSTNRMTIFGGDSAGGGFLGDAWVLTNANGVGGTPAWIQLPASALSPAPRTVHTAVYNPASNVMTVFAGAGALTLNDVFILTHADGL